MAMTEADTCRRYVVPKLREAGWDDDHIREQVSFTAGRIIPTGNSYTRKAGKRADYVLDYRPNVAIAVVEAKSEFQHPAQGLQQAMEYAQTLGLSFAYSTNGHGIVEHDFITGLQRTLDTFPSPEALWQRLQSDNGLSDADVADAVSPLHRTIGGKQPRYYQEIAINRAVQAVLSGQKRILITMATGTGKTFVAFQIVWKLWKARRKTRILYLADRNVLVDQAKSNDFAPLGDAVTKIQGRVVKSREVYFAIYQAIADHVDRPGLFRQYPRDFFDLILVDECHRGSADDEGNWRQILEYFDGATQIGMTATPRRADNADTYAYFGEPIYTYSLQQGIDDGFLAPYRVLRVVPSADALGWQPKPGELDRFGREIPDGLYGTKDFERVVSLFSRTQTVAKHLAGYLRETDPMGKTIVFCVDQEHALEMMGALKAEMRDFVQRYPHYIARVVSDEKKVGRGHLDNFQDPEKATPVILTTSQLLTTGVDAPTVKNVVLFKPINSMTDFKQIIGRGTRVSEAYGKAWFTIVDYTGATRLFRDPAFDGDPFEGRTVTIDPSDVQTSGVFADAAGEMNEVETPKATTHARETPRKYYVDGAEVWIMGEQAFEMDPNGSVLRTVHYTDYTRAEVRRLLPDANHLRAIWPVSERRDEIIEQLRNRGVDLDALAEAARQPDADPLDLLLHVAYDAPLVTRRERVRLLKSKSPNFLNSFTPAAREVLDALLEKYADFGLGSLSDWPKTLGVPPLSDKGTSLEIAARFGGAEPMRAAVEKMQTLLYAD